MDAVDVERSVAVVTGRASPDDDERLKLRRGDAKLMAVLRTGHTLSGRPLPPPLTDPAPRPLLSPRQRDVGRLLLEGMTVAEIADRLNVSYFTAQTHVRALARRLEQRFAWRAAVIAAICELL